MTVTAADWGFMGLGAVLFYGASQMRRVLTAGAQARRVGVMGTVPVGAGALSELLPSDIMAAINQAPVMQQGRAGKSYERAMVCWQVSFESAFATGPFSLRLMCQDRGNFPWVNCDVRRGKYPQLSGLLPHAPLTIQGRIYKIKPDEIFLHKVTLSFPE